METLQIENHTPETLALLQEYAKTIGVELTTEKQREEARLQSQLELKKQGKTRLDVLKQYQGFITINDLEAVLE